MVISLIGYRATGKTTVAVLLAETLGWRVVDTDAEIERQTGQSIRSIFEQSGEQVFRDFESQVIERLVRQHKLVLSLGGGAILREQNRTAISVAGAVIWLTATPETIAARLTSDPMTAQQRPTLTGAAPEDEVCEVLQARQSLYAQVADYQLATDNLAPGEIVQAIRDWLDLREQHRTN